MRQEMSWRRSTSCSGSVGAWIWVAGSVALSTAACGSSGGTSGGSYAGVYSATYSGTYAVSSPASVPNGSNTDTATITITQLSATEVQAVWQLPGDAMSGSIDFALSSGGTGNSVGIPTGGSCFTGVVGSNGNTQTNCCTSCSITFSGDGFVQPNTGTFTGVTTAGVDYSGTYSGTWVGTKM